jgi:hypothetical protein
MHISARQTHAVGPGAPSPRRNYALSRSLTSEEAPVNGGLELLSPSMSQYAQEHRVDLPRAHCQGLAAPAAALPGALVRSGVNVDL